MADRFLTPRQEAFLAYYTNPKSATFSNAYQSAIKAGFSHEYAETITAKLPDWLAESVGDAERLKKAEKVLDKTLTMPVETVKKVGEEEMVVIDPQLVKIQQDTAKFVASTMGKAKYSTRTEHTGQGGAPLQIKVIAYTHGDNDTPQLQSPELSTGPSEITSEVQDSGIQPESREV